MPSVSLEHDAQFPQWLKDLDAVAVDVLVQSVGVDRVGQVHRRLDIAASAGSAASAAETSRKASLTPRLG